MPRYYFTFGIGHPLGKYFRVIEAESYEAARKRQVEDFRDKWAFQYTEKEWSRGKITQAEEYGYKQI